MRRFIVEGYEYTIYALGHGAYELLRHADRVSILVRGAEATALAMRLGTVAEECDNTEDFPEAVDWACSINDTSDLPGIVYI